MLSMLPAHNICKTVKYGLHTKTWSALLPSTAGVATQMQHPSGPDKARKSTEPQPGVKRKRSVEPQPPSGAPEGYPSTDDGSDKAKKRKAIEVHHLHLNYSRAAHAGHDFTRVASNMQLEISDMASHFPYCCVKLVSLEDQCDTVLFLFPSLTELKIGI